MKSLLINVVGFQLCWLGLVLQWPLAMPIAAAYLLWHGLVVADASERRLLVLVALGGILMDGLLTTLGVFRFQPEPLWIPLWLTFLWIVFATTLKHSLYWAWTRAWWFIPLSGLGSASSYLAGARLGAVDLPLGYALTTLILLCVWSLFWTALWLSHRRDARSRNTHAAPSDQNQDPASLP